VQGRLTGWSKGSRQMEHFGTAAVSGSALLERLDRLAAVARLRRLGMARGSRHRNRQRAVGAVLGFRGGGGGGSVRVIQARSDTS
jgi:hypothetical protein